MFVLWLKDEGSPCPLQYLQQSCDLSSLKADIWSLVGGLYIGGLLSMTAQGVGQLYYPSCLIPTPPPPIPVNDFLSDAPFGDLENFPMVGFKVRQWVWFVWYLVNVCHTDQTSCLQAARV